MTPTLFDLPVRAPEAAELGVLIFEQIGERPITPDVRGRILARSVLLKLDTIKPYFASLERDPIHPSAVYLAVDGIEGQPLMLRLAPNATPASGLFPKSILIGRVPGPKGLELVVNATPFSHENAEQIRTFANEVNRAFLPKAASSRSAILVDSGHPELVYPAAIRAFQRILTERNLNMAGFKNAQVGSWAAIRAGWREGFIATAQEIIPAAQLTKEKQRAICEVKIDTADQAADIIDECSQFLL